VGALADGEQRDAPGQVDVHTSMRPGVHIHRFAALASHAENPAQ
jgi:hypothetical protein